jgi:glutamyl-tRNA synthetase
LGWRDGASVGAPHTPRRGSAGLPLRYDGTWRDRDSSTAPKGISPVIRLRAPLDGETVIADLVQGSVRVANQQLDDMVLLRADGTPTYMLSVVVDDHDMEVTHIIRGDDHLTNSFRQYQIYRAMGWACPQFAHIPLIHGPDGAKLSKRHGALGVDAYRAMGYLPEALRNYLLRLGWSHGDDEIISTEQAIEWFDLPAVGRSAARFDFAKLNSLNAHYMRSENEARLADQALSLIERPISPLQRERFTAGLGGLKSRAQTLVELVERGGFYLAERPLELDASAAKLLDPAACTILAEAQARLSDLSEWNEAATEACVRELAETRGLKMGSIAQPLRIALTGATASPSLFEVMNALGRSEALGRIDDALATSALGAPQR